VPRSGHAHSDREALGPTPRLAEQAGPCDHDAHDECEHAGEQQHLMEKSGHHRLPLRLMVFRSGKFQNSEPASWFHAGALGLSASTVRYHCTLLAGARHTVSPTGPLKYPASPKAFATGLFTLQAPLTSERLLGRQSAFDHVQCR
jgi:hypothetical protein